MKLAEYLTQYPEAYAETLKTGAVDLYPNSRSAEIAASSLTDYAVSSVCGVHRILTPTPQPEQRCHKRSAAGFGRCTIPAGHSAATPCNYEHEEHAHGIATPQPEQEQQEIEDRLSEFLYGFARGADIDRSEACAQWAGYSSALSDNERRMIEKDGDDAGFSEGQAFARMFTETAEHADGK